MKLGNEFFHGNTKMEVGFFHRSNSGNLIGRNVFVSVDNCEPVELTCEQGLNLGKVSEIKTHLRIISAMERYAKIINDAIEIGGIENVKKCLPHGLCNSIKCYEKETMIDRFNQKK